MPKTLLLADDSITIQKVVGIIFATEDFKVTTVDNGEDALRKARELKPDLILADVVMPRKNGYELCEAVKADAELKDIPVLLLAGTFEAFDENRARAAQADGHLAKPFDSQALVAKVKELVQARGGVPIAQPQAAPAAPAQVTPVAPQRPAVAPQPAVAAPRPMAAPYPGAPARSTGPFPPGAGPRPGVRPAAVGRPLAAPAPRPPGSPPPGMAPRPPGAPAALRPGMAGPGAPGQRPVMPGARPPPGRMAPPPGARSVPGAPFPPRPMPAMRPPGASAVPPAARPAPAVAPFRPPGVDPQALEARSGQSAPPPAAAPTAPVPLDDDWSDLGRGGAAKAAPMFQAPPSNRAEPASGLAAAVQESTGLLEPQSAAIEPLELPDLSAEEADKPIELAAASEFIPAVETTGHKPQPIAAPAASTRPKDGGEAQLREALSHASLEVIERIAWEVVPQLAETIIREQIDRLAKERQGQ